ncbi:MAG: hypothetical protein LLG04_13775 [Parachlamydia sp.]|nr:hypothetical protein [Parachlamydia sp.]
MSRLIDPNPTPDGESFECPLFRLLWERNTYKTVDTAYDGMFSPEVMASRSYRIHLNHGHDGKGARVQGTEKYVENLDNMMGALQTHIRPDAARGLLKTTEAVRKKKPT